MKILGKKYMHCICCMADHTVQTVSVTDENMFKGVYIEYNAEYHYCDRTHEFYTDEQQLDANDIAMKNAYREKVGLLTSNQIAAIRNKYGISQADLCTLLGWGGKTITRYEGHQVQDVAHDTILRKLDSDPEWFLQLLSEAKDVISASSYEKYANAGVALFEQDHDLYLKSAIMAKYARFLSYPDMSGGKSLSLDTVTDMIRYYANSQNVTNLFLVKLLKLLWYADALSFKRRGHAISGLVYRALPMGAVPVAYRLIVDLSTIHCEEVDIYEETAYKFLPDENHEYHYLTPEDIEILDAVIHRFGDVSRKVIVDKMHQEDAYKKTASKDIIRFTLTQTLSLS